MILLVCTIGIIRSLAENCVGKTISVNARFCFVFRFGVVYHGSVDNKLHVTFHGKRRQFTLHDVLEFDSDRKCMSVIIEDDKGACHLGNIY